MIRYGIVECSCGQRFWPAWNDDSLKDAAPACPNNAGSHETRIIAVLTEDEWVRITRPSVDDYGRPLTAAASDRKRLIKHVGCGDLDNFGQCPECEAIRAALAAAYGSHLREPQNRQ